MSATYAVARDEITRQVHSAWVTANPSYPMLFDDRKGQKPATDIPWARLTVQHNRGDQEALANAIGRRLFSRDGLVIVQIFTPAGEGLRTSDALAKVVSDALEGKATPNGVWFRNVRLREVGPDGAFHQVNVIAEFVYSEAK